MKKYLLLLVFVAALFSSTSAFSADDKANLSDEEKLEVESSTITTKEGLTFRVPKDMPIEMRNGIQAPVPIEEYMYAKFKKVEKRMSRIDEKLDNIEKLLISLKEEKAAAETVLKA